VREHGEALPASHRDGLAPLIDRLEQRRREGYARARDEGAGAFAAVAPKLERSLSRYTVAVETDGVRPERFGVACASALREHAGALVDALEAVSGPGDVAHAHRARIAAKRLRYLLEPIADLAPGAPSAVKRLKGLQDALGELHDLHVLAAELSPQPGCDRPSPALAELRGRLQAEIAERWAAIAADWIRPGNGRDRKGVRALARKVDEVAEHAEEIAGASRKKGRNGRS